MLKSTILKVSLLAVLVMLFVSVPIVNAQNMLLNWTSPTKADLMSVFMVDTNNAWAVGHGTIIRWDGTNWSNVTSPTPTTLWLYSVYMTSVSNGWAVGSKGTIIHWNGVSWSNVTSPIAWDLYSVYMVGANDGWAVDGGGAIIRWNGTSWSLVTSPTLQWLSSVFMVSASDGWAVGGNGIILRWNGTQWIPEFPSFLILPLFMIATLVAVIVYRRKNSF